MPSRQLDFPVFDADNHMYETTEAFTRHLPERYRNLIRYVQVDGRTKIAVRGLISEYIPNPTFEVVAAPGAQADYFKFGNPEGKSRREIMGQPIRALPGFMEPEPRLRLMDDLGIDRALMWPTLASLLEERLRDDPEATHAVIHSLNQWMEEQWTFGYQDRIFPTPIITLPVVEKAIEELEWVLERGARIVLVRPAPVPGHRGSRSMALPEFDPFWERVVDADVVVGMHASDSGYQRYVNEWEGVADGEMLPFKGMSAFAAIIQGQHRAIFDTVASLIGHGLCTRFPTLKIAPVENGSAWVRPLLETMAEAYDRHPTTFEEDPVAVFKRNVYVHPFHEEDPVGLIELLGADRVIFGSDYPHPEGMADPISFVDELGGLGHDDVAKVMGGNLSRIMGVAACEERRRLGPRRVDEHGRGAMVEVMQGVRVVEVASWTYVPMAGAVLAEWGADVIKVEHPVTGDPQRGLVTSGLVPTGPGGVAHMMELPNRGKRSVGLDLADEEGHQVLLELCRSADVFVTNFRPQARRKLRIDVEDIRAAAPDIVYVRGSGLGQRGPEAERGGYDNPTFWGRGGPAGILSGMLGDDEYPGPQPGAAFGDVIGGLTIAGGIAAALLHRERTGEAVVVDNSLLATGMWATGATTLAAGLFGISRMPAFDRRTMPNPLVNNYRTADGRFLNLCMLDSDRYWADLVTVMGHPELAEDPRFSDAGLRAANAPDCVDALDAIFAERTFTEWKALLLEAKGVWAPVQTPDELLEDPQALANGYIREVDAASGTRFRMVASPLQFDEQPPDLTRAPEHGEHTDEVLQEIGLDMDRIMELKIKGAVL